MSRVGHGRSWRRWWPVLPSWRTWGCGRPVSQPTWCGAGQPPKGGTHDPMDRRAVVLLPVVHRLCAALRARLMRDWLREAGVLRAGSAAAADSLVWLFGLELEMAHADDDPAVGILQVIRPLTAFAVARGGFASWRPTGGSGPMLHCYGMQRRVWADGPARAVLRPVRGLAPGPGLRARAARAAWRRRAGWRCWRCAGHAPCRGSAPPRATTWMTWCPRLSPSECVSVVGGACP